MPAVAENLDYYPKQTFTCSGCGSCCNTLEVTITEAEKQAIENFRLSPPADPQTAFIKVRERLWNIAKTPTGKCVFLANDGRCRLHSQGGISLKPLACRLYPFTIHWWEDHHVSIDCRYYCPAVGDRGSQPLPRHENYFRAMASLLRSREKPATVKYSPANPAGLDQVRCVNAAFRRLLGQPELPLQLRLYTAARIMDFHSRPDMHQDIADADAAFVRDAEQFAVKAHDTLCEELSQAPSLNLDERMKFRLAMSSFFRDDAGRTSYRERLRRGLTMLRWTVGRGSLHELNISCPNTQGHDVFSRDRVTVFTEEAIKLLEQFIMAKVTAMHHCGPAALGLSWEDGMRHLLTAIPAAGAGAALLARITDRSKVDIIVMRHVINYIDTAFRLSPAFRSRQHLNTINHLCRPRRYAALLNAIFVPKISDHNSNNQGDPKAC